MGFVLAHNVGGGPGGGQHYDGGGLDLVRGHDGGDGRGGGGVSNLGRVLIRFTF